ncbi:MAG: SPFH domain-containing protein [Planctomycetota bacterium]
MSEPPQDPNPTSPPPVQKPAEEPGLDAAQQSLSDALRVSFRVLKVVMVLLMIVYVFSGVFRVDEKNTAVRYRFGEEIGTYGPGWHFGLPFPIEQIVMVPSNTQTIRLNESFWYNNPEDQAPEALAMQPLNPLNDSFLITGDTNVIHVQFGVNYVIDPERVDDYLRNIGTIDRANEMVQTAVEQAMIHYVATANVEDIITRGSFKTQTIADLTQTVLNDLAAGITIQQVLIDNNNQSMPNQVRQAYVGVTQAQADKAKTIQEARRQSNQILGETAGGAHTELLTMIRAYEWSLAGDLDGLAAALRSVLNKSLTELRLPSAQVMEAIDAYQQAATDAVGTVDESLQTQLEASTTSLMQVLEAQADADPTGKRISGQIASAISEANAMRFQISTKAEQDYLRYASDLAAYQRVPRLLAATRLQEARERVMSDVLVQTIVGPITRINTNSDPEVVEEISEADRERRLEEARLRAEEERR